jgi:hypothetical protein
MERALQGAAAVFSALALIALGVLVWRAFIRAPRASDGDAESVAERTTQLPAGESRPPAHTAVG